MAIARSVPGPSVLHTVKHGRDFQFIVLLCGLLLFPSALWAAEANKDESTADAEPQATFVLTTQDDRLSLQAIDAPLKEVLEEMGRRMHVAVEAQIPADEKLTLAFDRLTLDEALQQLGRYTNYVYLQEANPAAGQVSKLLIFPKRDTAAPASPTPHAADAKQAARKAAPRPEPFKFEFDPSQYEQKSE